MAENNAATNNAPVAAPKAPSKMDKCKELFLELVAAETDGKIPEGSSKRKEFIARAQSEHALTKAGAITYYNNLQNWHKGDPLYIKPKKAAKPANAAPQAEKTEETEAGDAAANAALTEPSSDTPADAEADTEQ